MRQSLPVDATRRLHSPFPCKARVTAEVARSMESKTASGLNRRQGKPTGPPTEGRMAQGTQGGRFPSALVPPLSGFRDRVSPALRSHDEPAVRTVKAHARQHGPASEACLASRRDLPAARLFLRRSRKIRPAPG